MSDSFSVQSLTQDALVASLKTRGYSANAVGVKRRPSATQEACLALSPHQHESMGCIAARYILPQRPSRMVCGPLVCDSALLHSPRTQHVFGAWHSQPEQ